MPEFPYCLPQLLRLWYGEVVVFYLPNSGIYMQISSKKWYRVDADNPDVYVMPDFPCPDGEVFETLDGLIVP